MGLFRRAVHHRPLEDPGERGPPLRADRDANRQRVGDGHAAIPSYVVEVLGSSDRDETGGRCAAVVEGPQLSQIERGPVVNKGSSFGVAGIRLDESWPRLPRGVTRAEVDPHTSSAWRMETRSSRTMPA